MPQLASRDAPKLARDPDIVVCRLLEAAALYEAHGGIDDGFRRQAMVHSRFQSEDVARQMKCANLAASVGQKLVGTNRAADHLIDVFGRLILAVNLFLLPVGEFRRDKPRMPGQGTELVGI